MYRSLPLPLVFLLLVSSNMNAVHLSAKEPPLHTTKNSFFTIPFEIKPNEKAELPAEVELIYSTDLGMQWFPYERVTPDKKQFLFKAQSDGEYWFIFNTYGKDGLLKQTKRRGPMLRVLVDTIPPKLTVEAQQRETGELFIQWSTEDANLSRIYPRLQVMYSIPDREHTYLSNWKPIAIDPATIQSEGNRHHGELVIWPDRDAIALEISAEMYDSSGNRETATQTISLAKNDDSKDSNVLTESMQTAFRDYQHLAKKRTEKFASSKVRTAFAANRGDSNDSGKKTSSVSLTPPRPLILSATQESQISEDAANSDGSSRALLPLPLPSPDTNRTFKLFASKEQILPGDDTEGLQASLLPQIANQADPQPPTTTSNEAVVPGPILFSERNDPDSLVHNERREAWERENSVDDTLNSLDFSNLFAENANSGPAFAVLNPKYGSEQPKENPNETEKAETFPPEAEIVAAENTNPTNPLPGADVIRVEEPGHASAWDRIVNPPQSAPPQTPPENVPVQPLLTPVPTAVQISKISHLRGTNSNQILLKWETLGPESDWIHSKNVKAHIYFGLSQRGPWIPIAINLHNTGSHTWNVNQSFRNPFFILVQLEGESRELVSDLTRSPIQLPATAFSR